MHAKGFNLGNPSKYIPDSSSFVQNLPLQEGFDLSDQYYSRDQVGFFSNWRMHPGINHYRNLIRNNIYAILTSKIQFDQRKLSDITSIVEDQLFINAASQDDYMNRETLMQRLKIELQKLRAKKYCQVNNSKMVSSSRILDVGSNASVRVQEPNFLNATHNSAVALNNEYNFPKGGLSSIPKCTDCLSDWKEASVLKGQSQILKEDPIIRRRDCLSGTSETMLPPVKRRKIEYLSETTKLLLQQQFSKYCEAEDKEEQLPNTHIQDDITDDEFVEYLEKQICTEDEDMLDPKELTTNNDTENMQITELDSNMPIICKGSTSSDIENTEGRIGLKKDDLNAKKKVIESKPQKKEMKSTDPTTKSLTRRLDNKGIMDDVYKCQLCSMGTLYFAPQPVYCFCCGIHIRRNTYYYSRREEDTQNCFCTVCYKSARGGNITFNGTSISKIDLEKKKNNKECEEAWIECSECKNWQHQICALYNDRRDSFYNAEYICPLCLLKENRNDVRLPLPMFDAKDLPKTMLSDHIEERLKKIVVEGERDKNPNDKEVFVADNLFVRVVLSVDKQVEVQKQFLNIFEEKNYPEEFSYTSKVILLFQKIDGTDVCLFAMYVQEFGSECGYPNKRSVYISYLDSVKYFIPKVQTSTRERLRTFVYHEILIGYLDFCKKRGFTTCYIWSCPPVKGEDYILYCHPETQKTPKKHQLRHWYHSMLRKAAEEDIVVGLTNIYDHFFLSTGKRQSKVTVARLPYFDGDFWSATAIDKARQIEQDTGGDYKKMLKLIQNRSLKSMGHVNLSKITAKDILVMQKLGQTILPVKEDFMVVLLQYVCIHCHKVIESGKRWFCTKCKIFQECERCHTADSHISVKGEIHKLCEVFMEDILHDTTKEKDIILENGLFHTRYNFLSFCQKNRLQFDSLRQAKYSSMMIIYYLTNPTHMTFGTICRVCCKRIVNQRYWRCENCPEFTVCYACHNARGAKCHVHTLNETCSAAESHLQSQELKKNSVMLQELLDVIKHASQCYSTQTQPCTYPYCLKIKKLFAHASRCTVRVFGGCQYCKKVWQGLSLHSRNCTDSTCRIPRCMDLKKQSEWLATQSESRRRAIILEDNKELDID